MTRRFAFLLALLLAACGPDEAPAPDVGDAAGIPDTTLAAVGGVAWGAPLDSVLARRGAAEFRREAEEGVTLLGYPARVFGTPSQLLYFVHPEEGMFRAGYMLEISTPEQCADLLQMVDQGLDARFPGLRGEAYRVGAVPGPPCETYFSAGSGYVKTRIEAESGRRVIITLLPGNPAVVLTYTTPPADAWEARKGTGRP